MTRRVVLFLGNDFAGGEKVEAREALVSVAVDLRCLEIHQLICLLLLFVVKIWVWLFGRAILGGFHDLIVKKIIATVCDVQFV